MKRDVTESRAEAGCVRFDLLTDQSAANKFCLYEVWASSAAFDQHCQTPHFKEFAAFRESGGLLSVDLAKHECVDF